MGAHRYVSAEKTLIIPYSDSAVAAIDENYEVLSEHFVLPTIGGRQGEIARLLDKAAQAELLSTLGICVLASKEISLYESEAGSPFSYPVVLKPASSIEGSKGDMCTCTDAASYASALQRLKGKGFARALVQEFAGNRTEYVLDGSVFDCGIAFSVVRNLRRWPPDFGAGCFAEIGASEGVRVYCSALLEKLRAFGYRGPIDVELFELPTGELLVNEVNWRSGGRNFVSRITNVHSAFAYYCDATRLTYCDEFVGDVGGLSMVEWDDVKHVLSGRVSLAQWIRDFWEAGSYAIWDSEDPKPFEARFGIAVAQKAKKLKEGHQKAPLEKVVSAHPMRRSPNVRVVEKPDSVSWDEIADVLHNAHQSNVEKGMHFDAAKQTGDEIREHLHGNGRFYLATVEDEVVGVGAVRFQEVDRWFHKGPCVDIVSVGVRSEYKGLGISKLLYRKLEEVAFEDHEVVTMNTAERNEIMLNSRLHDGWIFVDYLSHREINFYSVMLAKWKDGCPYSTSHCAKMFRLRKTRMKLMRDEDGNDRALTRAIKTIARRRTGGVSAQ